jgi:EAL domain-containing protein (putative c-di-GMP-specific phosphodiesterase class I)
VFSIKVTPSLLHDDAFIADLIVILSGLPKGQLALELTALSATDHQARSALKHLARSGALLIWNGPQSSDCPSLPPFAQIKLGQEFARFAGHGEAQAAHLRKGIALAHARGCKVIAQGAESPSILAAIEASGADFAQGWEVGKPLPWEEFRKALALERRSASERTEAAA